MSLVGDFIDAASSLECRKGSRNAVHEIAARQFPEPLGLGRLELLRGDMHVLWVEWFLQSITDRQLTSASYASCFEQALTVLGTVLPNTVASEREHAARAVATAIRSYMLARNPKRRMMLNAELEWTLFDGQLRAWVAWTRKDVLDATNETPVSA